jgi:hypothetical protein
VKRFLTFVGDHDNPLGGIYDLLGDYDTLLGAQYLGQEAFTKDGRGWVHVLDTQDNMLFEYKSNKTWKRSSITDFIGIPPQLL